MAARATCPPGSITIDAAVHVVLSHTQPLDTEERAPFDALGATLAAPVIAPLPHPPFPASIKDGYALRSADASPRGLRSTLGTPAISALAHRLPTPLTTPNGRAKLSSGRPPP